MRHTHDEKETETMRERHTDNEREREAHTHTHTKKHAHMRTHAYTSTQPESCTETIIGQNDDTYMKKIYRISVIILFNQGLIQLSELLHLKTTRQVVLASSFECIKVER